MPKKGPLGGVEPARVDGLADFLRDLKEIDPKLARALGQVNKAAADLIAGKARSAASSHGSTLAHAAPSIRAAADQKRSKIFLGGPGHPEALGAEFGGQRRPTTQQFEPWRGSDHNAGYALFPAIREGQDAWVALYDRSLQQLFRSAFPD